jgi:hypothetical protein
MTSEEYLRRLKRALANHPDSADIASDIAEHFAAGMAAGRGESLIAASLQTPERLARAYRAKEFARNSRPLPGIGQSIRLLWHTLADRFCRLSGKKRRRIITLAGAACLALLFLAGYTAANHRSAAILDSSGLRLQLPLPPAFSYLMATGFILGSIALIVVVPSSLRRAGLKARKYLLEHDPASDGTEHTGESG